MNLQKNVTLRETLKIVIGELILLPVMSLLFLAFDHFSMAVIWGGLLGAGLTVLYFFLICLGVNHVIDGAAEPGRPKQIMTLLYLMRLGLLGVGLIIGLKFDCFNNIALIVPVLMMRPILTLAELIRKEVK